MASTRTRYDKSKTQDDIKNTLISGYYKMSTDQFFNEDNCEEDYDVRNNRNFATSELPIAKNQRWVDVDSSLKGLDVKLNKYSDINAYNNDVIKNLNSVEKRSVKNCNKLKRANTRINKSQQKINEIQLYTYVNKFPLFNVTASSTDFFMKTGLDCRNEYKDSFKKIEKNYKN